MDTNISKYSGAAARADQDLSSKIQVQGRSVETFGPTSQIRGVGRPSLGFNSPINFTHTAASGAAEVIKLGDPEGAVAALGGFTTTNYTSGTPFTNAVLNAMLRKGMVIGEVNYAVGAVAQFNSTIDYGSINLGGTFSKRPLQNIILSSKRNTQQNALLLTLDFSGQGIVLNSDNALFISCAASQTISQFTVNPAAVKQ
jgi:hypothetical protein